MARFGLIWMQAAVLLLGAAQVMASTPKGLYREDNRLDQVVLADARFAMKATAAVFESADMRTGEHGLELSHYPMLGAAMSLCPGEPFSDQPSAARCTAVLIEPQLAVTAAHCVKPFGDQPQDLKLVFDFVATDGKVSSVLSDQGIHSISNIHLAESDVAFLVLEHAVVDRVPLKLNPFAAFSKGDQVSMIGYPSGVPAKTSFGAIEHVLSDRDYYLTSIDAFAGNSGSGIFKQFSDDPRPPLLEGMLLQGGQDYSWDQHAGCFRSVSCQDVIPGHGFRQKCIGEKIISARQIARAHGAMISQSRAPDLELERFMMLTLDSVEIKAVTDAEPVLNLVGPDGAHSVWPEGQWSRRDGRWQTSVNGLVAGTWALNLQSGEGYDSAQYLCVLELGEMDYQLCRETLAMHLRKHEDENESAY